MKYSQLPTTKQQRNGWSGFNWATEVLSLVAGTALLAALITLLAVFDRKPIFGSGITNLNSIVAAISTLSKACLMYTVSECMGQWKWFHFASRKRSLLDFERIDLASRGVVASANALIHTSGRATIFRMGAFITVLAVAMGTFSQLLIQFESTLDWRDDADGITPIALAAKRYSRGNSDLARAEINEPDNDTKEALIPSPLVDLAVRAVILSGLMSLGFETERQRESVQCPTPYCRWESEYQSLAVCHRCEQVEFRKVTGAGNLYKAASLSKGYSDPGPVTAFILPNGHFIMNPDEDYIHNPRPVCSLQKFNIRNYGMTTFSTGNAARTNAMKDLDTLIWSTSFIRPSQDAIEKLNGCPPKSEPEEIEQVLWPDVDMQAMECAIYYCVKSFNSSIENNVLREEVTGIPFIRDPGSSTIDTKDNLTSLAVQLEDSIDYFVPRTDLRITSAGSNSLPHSFNVSEESIRSMRFQIDSLLSFWVDPDHMVNISAELAAIGFENGVGYNGQIFNGRASPEALTSVWDWSVDAITDSFASLAAGLTNNIISNRDDSIPSSDPQFDRAQLGQVGVPTTIYRIRWHLISLHVILTTGTIAFWALTSWTGSTMVDDSGMGIPLLKNHSLALLARSGQTTIKLQDLETRDEVNAAAKFTFTKL